MTCLALSKTNPHLLERTLVDDEGDEDGDDAEPEWPDYVRRRYVPVALPLSLKGAEAALYWNAESESLQRGSNILRIDHVNIGSNFLPEDGMTLGQGRRDDELQWIIAGIYDGHAGSHTTEALQRFLPNYIIRHLTQNLSPKATYSANLPLEATDKALKAAFLELDQDLMAEATAALTEPRYLNDALPALQTAYAGSCALVVYYNSDSKVLKTACTGDSRAVLGRRNAAGEWEAIPLSEDQTGHNESEKARLEREHPNEPDMIKDGRLLGLAVTRAFGDSRWKWSREQQEQARDRFFGPQLREPLLTPPYLTAEPVITTTAIEPERGDFLILASDGLWDELSSAQAVDLVGRWLQTNDVTKEAAPPAPTALATAPTIQPLPTTTSTEQKSTTNSPPTKRINPAGSSRAYTTLSPRLQNDSSTFIVKDNNAAVHLARNALGGSDEDRLCGLMTAQPPHARNMRDDITVQVIFFGNDPNVIYT